VGRRGRYPQSGVARTAMIVHRLKHHGLMHNSLRVIGVLPDLVVSVILGLRFPVGGVRADASACSCCTSAPTPR